MEQLKNDWQNVGLLAALASTIAFAMLAFTFSEDFIEYRDNHLPGLLFTISWTLSSLLTLLSTIMSVFLLMAIERYKSLPSY